jgi:DNA polymerase III delta prime subunit
MQQKQQSPPAIFSVCAPSDIQDLERWEVHLRPLEQAGTVSIWSVRHLQPGTDRLKHLYHHLDQADFVVLLLSADFFTDDECEALMEHALKRYRQGAVRVIPLLLRPFAFRETKLATFTPFPSDGRPVVLWENSEAALDDCVREIRRILGRPITASLTRRKRAEVQEQNRQRLLHRVRSFWIAGVLEQSLHGAALLALGLKEQPDALANPWRLIIQESEQISTPLPDGTRMTDVYDSSGGELLILGEPGSGKTTLLLDLARDLLSRAEQKQAHPIPVVFNLSSWTRRHQSLATWLIEELATKYQVPKKVGSDWINTDQILPLLDGLDEVDVSSRPACIQAINEYHQVHSLIPLVVCCRVNEYTSQTNRLVLFRAVAIQPLTTEQIDEYLTRIGEQVMSLHVAIQQDPVLQELATTPLMLTILIIAYQGSPLEEIEGGVSTETRQQQIFATYTQRMLKRRSANSRYGPQQTTHWLSYLARQMKQQSQSIFFLERMQPDWVPKNRRQQLFSALIAGLVGILLFSLSNGLIFGLTGLFYGSQLHPSFPV